MGLLVTRGGESVSIVPPVLPEVHVWSSLAFVGWWGRLPGGSFVIGLALWLAITVFKDVCFKCRCCLLSR